MVRLSVLFPALALASPGSADLKDVIAKLNSNYDHYSTEHAEHVKELTAKAQSDIMAQTKAASERDGTCAVPMLSPNSQQHHSKPFPAAPKR